jgi:hypothetical protein
MNKTVYTEIPVVVQDHDGIKTKYFVGSIKIVDEITAISLGMLKPEYCHIESQYVEIVSSFNDTALSDFVTKRTEIQHENYNRPAEGWIDASRFNLSTPSHLFSGCLLSIADKVGGHLVARMFFKTKEKIVLDATV